VGRVRNLVSALVSARESRGPLDLVGAGLILASGLVHLLLTREHFEEATYLGLLFLADFVGAAVAAFGIYQGYRWGWVLGALVAAGAFTLYVVSGTGGLPGVEGHDVLEPLGLITKMVEALFLGLCVFKLAGFARWAPTSGLAAALMIVALGAAVLVAVPSLAADDSAAAGDDKASAAKGKDKAQNKMAGWSHRWKATSPGIHLGDKYDLLVSNKSDEDQRAQIRTVIMDHANKTNTPVIEEKLELAPGEERRLTTTNEYGIANHFNTIIGSETEDLGLSVTVTDDEGTEIARYNERAFLIQEAKGKAKGKAKDDDHKHK
jgi:hypothetical protein